METMREIVLQELNEERYNRKHIDKKIRDEIENNPEMVQKIQMGAQLLKDYASKSYYASKNKRIAQLAGMDFATTVLDIFVGIAYFPLPELFTAVTAQIAARLKFNDKVEAIQTVAEMIALLCETDAFDLIKSSKQASLRLVSRIPLSYQTIHFINGSEVLPPMVCEPLELTHNYSSGYLTHNDSLILGAGNHHSGDICLDVLNIMNSVQMRLNPEFLDHVSEEPTHALETPDQVEQWHVFKNQSAYFYNLLIQQGNAFYFTHKVDKRGRIYSCGYHLNPQGTPYKKAQLELAVPELVQGVPA